MRDVALQRKPHKTTYTLLRRTIAELNSDLSDSTSQLQDSTVAVVLSLAMLTSAMGDVKAAEVHQRGLQRMVEIRGGVDGFRDNTRLHMKLGR